MVLTLFDTLCRPDSERPAQCQCTVSQSVVTGECLSSGTSRISLPWFMSRTLQLFHQLISHHRSHNSSRPTNIISRDSVIVSDSSLPMDVNGAAPDSLSCLLPFVTSTRPQIFGCNIYVKPASGRTMYNEPRCIATTKKKECR